MAAIVIRSPVVHSVIVASSLIITLQFSSELMKKKRPCNSEQLKQDFTLSKNETKEKSIEQSNNVNYCMPLSFKTYDKPVVPNKRMAASTRPDKLSDAQCVEKYSACIESKHAEKVPSF